MTVGSEFEGVRPTPPGVGQRLEVRGSKKEARGFDPPDPPANRTLVSSANNIKFKVGEIFARSLMYKMNRLANSQVNFPLLLVLRFFTYLTPVYRVPWLC